MLVAGSGYIKSIVLQGIFMGAPPPPPHTHCYISLYLWPLETLCGRFSPFLMSLCILYAEKVS